MNQKIPTPSPLENSEAVLPACASGEHQKRTERKEEGQKNPTHGDIAGIEFGMLTAIRRVTNRRRHEFWLFGCQCGNEKEIAKCSVVRGHTTNCGCLTPILRSLNATKHGHTSRLFGVRVRSHEYGSWASMKARCLYRSHNYFEYYGGRGITICPEWIDSFSTFLADMGPSPSPSHSIHRIDNDGNYHPGNCKWATMKEQSRSKRNNTWVKVNGEKLILKDASKVIGVGSATIGDAVRVRRKLGITRFHYRGFEIEILPKTDHCTRPGGEPSLCF